MGSDLPGEGIKGGRGREVRWESLAKGRGRKGAFFIGFLERRRRKRARKIPGVVVDSGSRALGWAPGLALDLESITARRGAPQPHN